jgi:hypothetical protein
MPAYAYLLCPKVPVLGEVGRLRFSEHKPEGQGAAEDAEDGDQGDPDIDKAGREIVAEGAQGPPALRITTKRLLEFVGRAEIAVAELLEGPVAGEGPGQLEDLLRMVAESHVQFS